VSPARPFGTHGDLRSRSRTGSARGGTHPSGDGPLEELLDPAFERFVCGIADEGLPGPGGNILLYSFELVESLAKSGRMDRALKHWRTLLDLADPLLLFSEEFDPASNRPLGNYPQAFTHIGVLRAAFALGLVGSDD